MSAADRHLLVIMARGDSRRMGRPKGMCRQAGDERPLVVRVRDLYHERGWRAVLIVRREDEQAYRRILQEERILQEGRIRLLVCPRGGDTARTLRHALLWQREHAPQVTHLWAHPVDLPSVQPDTLDQLLNALDRRPAVALRPVHDGIPGHPVILSAAALEPLLRADPGEKTMRGFWRDSGLPPMTLLPVTDPGIVQDCDHPAALEAAPFQKEDPS